MNFLAHLHIADSCQSSLLGNLLGDFVKGDPDRQFPQTIAQGIRLHRFVDSYTDAHPLMKQAKVLFPEGQRRFAGIALDVMWDHYLARQWKSYHSSTLNGFCLKSEKTIQDEQTMPVPERFVIVVNRMWRGRWLESYQHLDNIEFALNRMSERSSRMTPLADCFTHLEKNYAPLEQLFSDFYPDLLSTSREFCVNSGN
ncbi:ACP phosphodiesterase [Vibrio kasasachensis]|uniref:acyl carrier protein phosphodiesterase n=1 Tax=Vibrio kasasachensis TaxID=2910248 RepID=UPI003D0D629D